MINSTSHQVDARSQQKNMTEVQALNIGIGLLSLPEVAEMLKVSRITLYRLVASGSLSVYRIGRRMRFHKDEVHDYLKRNHYVCTKD